MQKFLFTLFIGLAALMTARPAEAQNSWIQIEAHPSLAEAQARAREYALALPDVNGFTLGGGWYALALGPYAPDDARARLNELRAGGAIPQDSYLAETDFYRQQFFPAGANALNAPPLAPEPSEPGAGTDTAQLAQAETAEPAPPPEPPEETPAEARRSEAQLSRDERAELQVALQWFGYYQGRIDAAFGPATRGAMTAYQESIGAEPTGVLTTRQRARLLEEYGAVLASIGLETVRDERAGIEIELPLAMVGFDRYDPPFAHYTEIDDSGVRVLLISQAGDESTLLGLFDIMQTLKIVPLEGFRERRRNEFTLTGENDEITSYTWATLTNGHVKGFTLIWPAGEDRRREVVQNRMKESFAALPDSVLPETVGEGRLDQDIDLLSGLEIRRPERSRSGFFIDGRGTVLTTAEAVQGCDRITLDEAYNASVVAVDDTMNLALLRPEQALAPLAYARFMDSAPRLKSEIAVAGYSYEGRLSAPTVTFGTLAEMQGLQGEETVKRLAVGARPGDVGGPVFDTTGSVLGMLLPDDAGSNRALPEDVAFAADAGVISAFLAANGYPAASSRQGAAMTAESITKLAADMTVLVSCWN